MSVKKILLGVIALAVVAGAGWWTYRHYFTACCGPTTNLQGTSSTGNSEPLAPGKPNDADSDGILDADEKAQGLNPAEYDTDGDGLSDKAEIERFKTDPKKADTDGDGFWDGNEIMNGYNPKGPGRLPTSTKP